MASPSGRKDGLRCDCGKLLVEKDPEMGLGVRCGRDDCRKFHPIGEINQRAAEFGNQQEKRREKMGKEETEGLKKIIEEAVKRATKDLIIYIDLMTIGSSIVDDRYSRNFSSGTFIRIENNIVTFQGVLGIENVPLDKVECVRVKDGPSDRNQGTPRHQGGHW